MQSKHRDDKKPKTPVLFSFDEAENGTEKWRTTIQSLSIVGTVVFNPRALIVQEKYRVQEKYWVQGKHKSWSQKCQLFAPKISKIIGYPILSKDFPGVAKITLKFSSPGKKFPKKSPVCCKKYVQAKDTDVRWNGTNLRRFTHTGKYRYVVSSTSYWLFQQVAMVVDFLQVCLSGGS